MEPVHTTKNNEGWASGYPLTPRQSIHLFPRADKARPDGYSIGINSRLP
ncbi:hypothetical protein SynSYN20_00263 [Synechococcus sp. SYN20]|nr:hypothetical protein SynSYN20_00263 [Synechococcus sp. SYN20]